MPTYDFINTKDRKKFTDMMSIADKEEYLKRIHILNKVLVR